MGTTFAFQLVCLPEARSQGGTSGHKQGMGWGMEASELPRCCFLPLSGKGGAPLQALGTCPTASPETRLAPCPERVGGGQGQGQPTLHGEPQVPGELRWGRGERRGVSMQPCVLCYVPLAEERQGQPRVPQSRVTESPGEGPSPPSPFPAPQALGGRQAPTPPPPACRQVPSSGLAGKVSGLVAG